MGATPKRACRPAAPTVRALRALGAVLAALLPAAPAGATPVGHVIAISVDGLLPEAPARLGPEGAPAFHRLMREGAFTTEARTDPDLANTLPNHATMLTGRGVRGPAGHH